MSDIDDIRRGGWKQGAIAPTSLVAALREQSQIDIGPDDLVIVISQDCDVVCNSFELEPRVEFLIARVTAERNGNLFRGKNPRRLQFDLDGRIFEVSCSERPSMDRRILAQCAADDGTRLPGNVAGLLPGWVAKRYTRAALPDALVERLRDAAKAFRRQLKRNGEFVSALFLLVEPADEIPEEADYAIELTILAPDEAIADEDSGMALKRLEADTDQLLSSVKGVTVREVSLRAESEYSYAELIRSIEWDVYDDLSFQD